MAFSDDGGGLSFRCDDVKLSIGSSTWATKLSQLAKRKGEVYIVTGALPDVQYIAKILGKRPSNIFIVVNESALGNAWALKRLLPDVRIAVHKTVNAKVLLVAPDTVWMSSDDFGKSKMDEAGVGFHSEEVFAITHRAVFERYWYRSNELLLNAQQT